MMATNVPQMIVIFHPVILFPVTEYATVCKAITNFLASLQLMNQDIMALVSDECVYHIVVE